MRHEFKVPTNTCESAGRRPRRGRAERSSAQWAAPDLPRRVPPVAVVQGHDEGMGQTALRPWRDGWDRQLLGHQCVLCELIGARENSWGIRVFTGRYVDAYLPRSGS